MSRFQESVEILAQAYKNNTLVSGNSCSCAVGNLVRERCGYTATLGKAMWIDLDANIVPAWYILVSNAKGIAAPAASRLASRPNVMQLANQQIAATRYNLHEVVAIETVFEKAVKQAKAKGAKDHIYEGLVAVYEQLAILDGISLQVKVPAELVFVK